MPGPWEQRPWVWGKDHTPRKPEAQLAKWGPDSSLHLPWKETQTRGRGGGCRTPAPLHPTGPPNS